MKINKTNSIILLAGLAFSACRPTDHGKVDLPNPSTADFSVTMLNGDVNTYVVENTTSGAFISSWTFETLGKSQQSKDTIFLARKGSYKVTLSTSSKGGASSITKTIDVPSTSPLAADFLVTDIGGHKYEVVVTTPDPKGIVWVFSNGTSSTAQVKDTVYFPFAGENQVSLTVQTTNGPSSFTKSITVASTDMSNPDLTDPIFVKLTGGLDDKDGKTWVLDLTPGGKYTGVGPWKDMEMSNSYWAYPAANGGWGGSWKDGAGKNEYTFKMEKYQYIPKNDWVSVHYDWAVLDFGKPYAQYGDLALQDPRHKPTAFILKNEGKGLTGYTLTFGEQSYMSYCDGRRNYEICQFSAAADSVWIRHKCTDLNNNPAANDPSKDGNQRVLLYTLKK